MNLRHNDPQTPHERAHGLASDRLDAPITSADERWLDEHLQGCADCRAVAADFTANRELLRAMPTPEPPRDLWARTSVRIERERAKQPAGLTAARGPRIRREALVGIAAVILVGLIAGRGLLTSGPGGIGLGSPNPAPTGGATPLAVAPGAVGWAAPDADGRYTVNMAEVDSVCPPDATPPSDCAPLDADAHAVVSLNSRPSSIILAPQAEQAAVVESAASTTGGSILVVPIERPRPSPTPAETPAASRPATSAPTQPPSAGPTGSASPAATESATPEGSPSASPSEQPTATPESSSSVGPSASPSESPVPTGTPAPTAAQALAIIKNVIVVGGDASYSPDGQWLAFSARPADGSAGPDVYVWHVGDSTAQPITDDHGTIFSDWTDNRILASRAGAAKTADGTASPLPTDSGDLEAPVSVILDPATGKQHGSRLVGVWRPVVDPSGRWAVYWTGSLTFDAASQSWLPADGRLAIAHWDDMVSGKGAPADAQLLVDAAVTDWEARWDPTGRYLGLWTADPAAPGLGQLNLLPIDRTAGRVDDSAKRLLQDTPALAGFAIGDGRIAWATPPGQDGEGSRLSVLAWKGPDAGRTRSEPAPEDIVVVR